MHCMQDYGFEYIELDFDVDSGGNLAESKAIGKEQGEENYRKGYSCSLLLENNSMLNIGKHGRPIALERRDNGRDEDGGFLLRAFCHSIPLACLRSDRT